jgi:hypothetical protein
MSDGEVVKKAQREGYVVLKHDVISPNSSRSVELRCLA